MKKSYSITYEYSAWKSLYLSSSGSGTVGYLPKMSIRILALSGKVHIDIDEGLKPKELSSLSCTKERANVVAVEVIHQQQPCILVGCASLDMVVAHSPSFASMNGIALR